MTRPWQTLATVATPEGPLELRRRGDDEFLIVVDGRILMTSAARRSEEALATLATPRLRGRRAPRVLVGGLGMGFTLRAALDALPAAAVVIVAELNREIVDWCRGPLAPLTGAATSDPRVTVEVADVAAVISHARPGGYDAILLDLYEGPYEPGRDRRRDADPIFGAAALARAHAALAEGGVFAVWGEDANPAFTRRLSAAGFEASMVKVKGGGRAHVVYLGGR
jgi:spermidine synthase